MNKIGVVGAQTLSKGLKNKPLINHLHLNLRLIFYLKKNHIFFFFIFYFIHLLLSFYRVKIQFFKV